MTSPTIEREPPSDVETVELPATDAVQRALHEATGHVYDELAHARIDGDESDERLSQSLFRELERLYIATAENETTCLRISYERVDRE
jgi:hypothetical protein